MVLVLAPFLLFPDLYRALTIGALLVLASLGPVRRLAGRPISLRTPLNGPLLLLFLSLGPAVLVSPRPEVSISHATVSLLGLGSFLAIVNCDPRWRNPMLAGGVLTISGAVLALLALFGTDWGPANWAVVGRVTDRLPFLISGLSNLGGDGLYPNEVGGGIALLLPAVISFVLLARDRGRQPLMDRWQILAWLGGVVAVLMLGVVLLTESRTAILVLAVIGAVVVGMRRRGFGVVVLAVLIAGGLLLVIGLVSGSLSDWLVRLDEISRSAGSEPVSWSRRIEIWRNALDIIRDYPITGNGLYAFADVARLDYFYDAVSPDLPAFHAHNLWLQAGTDLGLVGLLSFIWLSAMLVLLGWAVRRRRQIDERLWLSGVWLGLIAWLGHGLLDEVPLGSRAAPIIWMMMGFLAATWQGEVAPFTSRDRTKQIRWAILAALLALLFLLGLWLSDSPTWYLNRGATVLDGVLLPGGLYADSVDREAHLSRAAAWIDSAAGLPGAARRLALVHYEAGELEQAAILFGQDSEAEAYLASRLRLLIAAGSLEEAQALVAVGLEAVPDSGRLTCLAGDIARLNGRLGEARTFYREVPEQAATFEGHDVTLAECYYQLGLAERTLTRWDAAAEWFGAAADLAPDRLEYQADYGLALYRATGDLNQAAAIEEAVLEADPGAVSVMLILADLYLEAERPQRSLEWSETAVASASHDPETWLRLAQAYWALEEWDEGRRALAEALRLDPENDLARNLEAEWGGQ